MTPPEYAVAEPRGLHESAMLTPMQTRTQGMREANEEEAFIAEFVAKGNLDYVIPQLARDRLAMQRIEALVRSLKTTHSLILGDARAASALEDQSIHLVVTSPPYWTLKRYNEHADQLGHVADYDEFNAALSDVWKNCYRALVPGGRLIINVGDVCLSRRKNNGRHTVVPLHAFVGDTVLDPFMGPAV